MKPLRRPAPGFTMVELLNVIAIIAIMAAILFPVFAQARESARRASCRSNLAQIVVGLHLYARDYDGRFPPKDDELRPLVYPYLNQQQLFRCPSDAAPRVFGSSANKTTGKSAQQLLRTVFDGKQFPPPDPLSKEFLCTYLYRGGLTERHRDLPVCGDPRFIHNGFAHVAYLDGTVRSLDPAHFTPFARYAVPAPSAPSGGPPGLSQGDPAMKWVPSLPSQPGAVGGGAKR
jgi:prepilin-type N-terminal cleavage/methylation domain-containing protein